MSRGVHRPTVALRQGWRLGVHRALVLLLIVGFSIFPAMNVFASPQSGNAPQSDDERQSDDGQKPEGGEQSGGETEAREEAQTSAVPQLMNLNARAGSNGCSYANPGTGAYAQSLCWFDMSGFTTEYRDRGWLQSPRYVSVLDPTNGPFTHTPVNATSGVVENKRWGPIQNYAVTIDLGGGYVLTATISTSSSGTNNARALRAKDFPTWGSQTSSEGAFLGRKGFYTGVQGEPAIYQAVDAGGGTSTVNLQNIRLTGPSGQEVRNYSIVVADAESTDASESLTWSTTGAGFRWLPNTPTLPLTKTKVMGNACSTAATPAWNSTVASSSASCTSVTSKKDGTAMLHTAPPANSSVAFDVTQSMKGSGKQGVAFGVITARVEATVQITDRVIGADGQPTQDAFQIAATLAGSSLLSTTAAGVALEATDVQGLPIDAGGSQVAYSTTVTGDTSDSYTEKWVCSKTNPQSSTPERWPSSGFSLTPPTANADFTKVKAGEYLGCTVIYTPPYLQLKKTVSNAGSYAPAPLPAIQNWNVTATGSAALNLPTVTGAGEATRTPVPVGTYQLSEAPIDGFVEAEGFEQVGWSCPTATVTGSQVSIQKGADVTCTVENKSLPGTATWSKVAKGDLTGTLLKGAEWKLNGPGVPANTTVTDCVTVGACGSAAFMDRDPTPGKFKLDGLRWGTYTLQETKAPAGYQVSSTVHTFTVGKDGTTFALNADWGDIENIQQPVPSIPISGGIGTDQIYMATAALLSLAGGAYVVKRIRTRQFTKKAGAATK